MRRWPLVLRAVAVICSLALVYSAVQALGFGPFEGLNGDPPNWVGGPLYWIAFANGTIAILAGWRGVTSSVAAVVVFGGVTTILAGRILQTFQAGTFTPPVIGIANLAGLCLAAIGIVQFEFRGLRATLSGRTGVVIGLGVGFGALVGEVVFELISAFARLLPLLWAGEVGGLLAPLVIFGGLRWLETAGIRLDDTLGVRSREHTGFHWNWRATIHFDEGPQVVRAGCIVMTIIGVITVLLTPTMDYAADTALSVAHTEMLCGSTWAARPEYTVDWSAIYFRWPDGCNGRSTVANWRYGVTGGLTVLAGVAGERIATIGD